MTICGTQRDVGGISLASSAAVELYHHIRQKEEAK